MSRTDYSGSDTLVPNGLRGYRFWTYFNGRLIALHHKYPWTPGINVSYCSMGSKMDALTGDRLSHKFDPKCTCGFYARYRPEDLLDLMISNVYTIVVGAIEATGRVAHGERGFRAEKARVLAICPVITLMHPARTTLPTIANYYRVPLFRDMDELVYSYPPDNVSAFIHNDQKQLEQKIRDINLTAQKIVFNSDIFGSLGHSIYTANTTTTGTTTGITYINPNISGA